MRDAGGDTDMTIELALDLAVEQIVLLGCRNGKWFRIAAARHDDDQFEAQILRLVRTAKAWTGAGGKAPACFLILPQDEVTRVALPIPDGIEAPDLVPEELGGALQRVSPDPIGSLRFDWRAGGGRLRFATCPKSILSDAEAYARSIGLAPVGCIAMADTGSFGGTAWFGSSRDEAHFGIAPGAGGEDLVSLDSREVAAHLPEAEQIRLDAALEALDRSRRAAMLDPANLRPLPEAEEEEVEDQRSQPAFMRTAFFWLRRGIGGPLRIAGLSLALVAGLYGATLIFANDPVDTEADFDLAIDLQDPIDEGAPVDDEEGIFDEGGDPDAAGTETPERETIASEFYTPSPGLARPAAEIDVDLADMRIPGLDPELGADALALDEVAIPGADQYPIPLGDPPPPDTTYAIDERGLVIPSPEGRETPGGYLVIAGRPSKLPALRPEQPPEPVEPPAPEVTDRMDLPEGDPLRTLSPSRRPVDLADNHERSRFGGRTEEQMTTLRPVKRSSSSQETSRAPVMPTASAISSGPRPGTRPAGLRERNMRMAALQKQPSAPAAPAAPSAAVQSGNASGSSSAAIAEQATTRAGIDLSSVSLLGTFGKTGSMRALVRMPGGSVLSVSVGDRVDGGQVQTISQGALTYVKRGRPVTLRMPSG